MTLVLPDGRGLDAIVARLNGELSEIAGLYAAASILPSDADVGVRLAGRELRDVRTAVAVVHAAFQRVMTGAA